MIFIIPPQSRLNDEVFKNAGGHLFLPILAMTNSLKFGVEFGSKYQNRGHDNLKV